MLQQFKGVAIVVAHRLTTICNCDKIIVMGDNGTKVEEGTHEELLQVPKLLDEQGKPVAGPGLYHTLWDTQQVDGKHPERVGDVQRLKRELEKQTKENMNLQQELFKLSSLRSRCHTFPEQDSAQSANPPLRRTRSLPRRGSDGFLPEDNSKSHCTCAA